MTTTDSRPAKVEPTSIENAPAGPDPLSGQSAADAHAIVAVEGTPSPQAMSRAMPTAASPAGSTTSHGQPSHGAQICFAVAAHVPAAQWSSDAHGPTGGGDSGPDRPATMTLPVPRFRSSLADPFLALAADVLDDLETVRVANQNRLRQLTRTATDSDGQERGFGLDETHPDVARLAALVAMLEAAEHQAALNLGRIMRRHPLGPWVKSRKGIGDKQGARLLASIGDPYWNTLHDRPRTVSQLWAYAGYHVIRTPVPGQTLRAAHQQAAGDGTTPASSQTCRDAQIAAAAGGSDGHPGHAVLDPHRRSAGVAPKRQRGQQSNWSDDARKRAWLVATKCLMFADSPYRPVYDATRAKYANAVHAQPCARCGPRGKPAAAGSDLSDGHKHSRAIRATAKAILKDLWREARAIHMNA